MNTRASTQTRRESVYKLYGLPVIANVCVCVCASKCVHCNLQA